MVKMADNLTSRDMVDRFPAFLGQIVAVTTYVEYIFICDVFVLSGTIQEI